MAPIIKIFTFRHGRMTPNPRQWAPAHQHLCKNYICAASRNTKAHILGLQGRTHRRMLKNRAPAPATHAIFGTLLRSVPHYSHVRAHIGGYAPSVFSPRALRALRAKNITPIHRFASPLGGVKTKR